MSTSEVYLGGIDEEDEETLLDAQKIAEQILRDRQARRQLRKQDSGVSDNEGFEEEE